MYFQIEIEYQPQLIIDYKIYFQDCNFLYVFTLCQMSYPSNKSFIILFYILGCWYCIEIKPV